MKELIVIKTGGKILENKEKTLELVDHLVNLNKPFVLVHGGGDQATRLASLLDIPTKMVEGRRITDEKMLEVVTMVYAGYINKSLVAALQARGINALGLSGADGNLIHTEKRKNSGVDFGFVGDVDKTSVHQLQLMNLLESGITPVFSSITHDGKGQLLNTNADTIAQAIAIALSGSYSVELLFVMDLEGVLENGEIIPVIDQSIFENLKLKGTVKGGMIPKLSNALHAIDNGVEKVLIGNLQSIASLADGSFVGTIVQSDKTKVHEMEV